MDNSNTQNLSCSLNVRARLARIATPTRKRYDARQKSAAIFNRLNSRLDKISQDREDATQEKRVDAAHKIATAARAAREESSSRLFGAVLGMGIAIATAGQIALALATI
jgi:hypothetical protein